jgi:hypothetical protein
MQFRTWLPAVGVVAMLASAAHGQARGTGFFSPAGVAAFTPEVDVVSSGVINDVQAVVSADRKYVTLNMRPSSTNLIALRNFTFQNGSGLGFVGSSGPNGGGGNANGNVNAVGAGGAGNVNNVGGAGRAAQGARAQAPAPSPVKPSVLDTPGMTRLG